MKIKFLGSGGSLRIPRACCSCKVCKEAREKGVPYERLGQSLFIEKENILFDTPEDINTELNNNNVKKVEHLFYSHWHPDHTAGYRVLEAINAKKKSNLINVYLTESLKSDFEKRVPAIFYFEKMNCCKINITDAIKLGSVKVEFIRLNNDFAYAFLIQDKNKKIVFCPCHCMHTPIMDKLKDADVLIMNLGYFGKDKRDITGFEKDNLRLIKELKPKKTIFTHIEETWNKSYDDYCKLEKEHSDLNLKFAFDGMTVDI